MSKIEAINLEADSLSAALLSISATEPVAILDSCGMGNLGSHLMIAGLGPVETVSLLSDDVAETLARFQQATSRPDLATVFTIAYDLGPKLEKLTTRPAKAVSGGEPDIFLQHHDCLVIHDYLTGETRLSGNPAKFSIVREKLMSAVTVSYEDTRKPTVSSNFLKSEYLNAIEQVKEYIRRGDTYQTNLTQQITARFSNPPSPQHIFARLRRDHPAPFAAFINRPDSTVVSASPERFLRISGKAGSGSRRIETSPIKGTRPRGATPEEDIKLRNELLTSEKDRAENTMIVDLLRNDIGRICEFGTVQVENLCALEEHPTLFHLVSTISGQLRPEVNNADVLKAVFPCGSITGAPKIRTMQIIEELEGANRGLSMGAIGYRVPDEVFGLPETVDMSVAIRTMFIRENEAVFNVGGGIVIDSDPEKEYEETLVKARALLAALGSPIAEAKAGLRKTIYSSDVEADQAESKANS